MKDLEDGCAEQDVCRDEAAVGVDAARRSREGQLDRHVAVTFNA